MKPTRYAKLVLELCGITIQASPKTKSFWVSNATLSRKCSSKKSVIKAVSDYSQTVSPVIRERAIREANKYLAFVCY